MLMVLLLLSGKPLAFAMGFAGFVGYAWLWGLGNAVSLSTLTAYNQTDSFVLMCVPLFILMGQITIFSRVADDIYNALYRWLSRLPGGLAMATTAACAFFAAICGSNPATAATIGSMALHEMKKYKYGPKLASGCMAAAGTLGIMIPPSIPIIECFTEPAAFKAHLDEYLERILNARPTSKGENVWYPGYPEYLAEQERSKMGIPFHREVVQWFKEFALKEPIPELEFC